MIGTMRRIADGLIAVAATIGSIGLVAEAVIILVDVVGRAVGAPLFGSQDLITMVMVAGVWRHGRMRPDWRSHIRGHF